MKKKIIVIGGGIAGCDGMDIKKPPGGARKVTTFRPIQAARTLPVLRNYRYGGKSLFQFLVCWNLV